MEEPQKSKPETAEAPAQQQSAVQKTAKKKKAGIGGKLGSIILHPFLFAAYPVMSALAANIDSFRPIEVIRATAAVLVLAGVVFWAVGRLVKDARRAGLIASLLLIGMLYTGSSYRLPLALQVGGVAISRYVIIFGMWGAAFAIVCYNRVWRVFNMHTITTYVNLVSAIPMLNPLRVIVAFYFLLYQDPLLNWKPPADPVLDQTSLSAPANLPDVYYIILDGYARADVLSEVYGFDNTAFTEDLEELGFYIADQSQSNYVQTGLSLASSLNLEYLDDLEDARSANRYPLNELIAHSQARRMLGELGYEFVSLSGGYQLTNIHDADLYLSYEGQWLTEFESLALNTSILNIFVDQGWVNLPIFGYETHRARTLYEFEQLEQLAERPGPQFVLAHFVAPHPPFVFSSQGEPTEPPRDYYIGDGTDFGGSPQEYMAGYREQVTFLNHRVLEMVRAVLERSETPPLIILQADHGPGSLLNWESIEDSCVRERVSILNAYYLPGNAPGRLYPTITPVNSFRLVFDTYFGTELGPLEDRSYFSRWSRPYDFIEVPGPADVPGTEPCKVP